jgi:acetylornithine/succinyldiaminopimelate/putrescine aminotransferase
VSSVVTDLLALSKDEILDDAIRYWNPGKTRFWVEAGTPLVIGRRDGYVLHDLSGREMIDVHLNGGTYNLGHRHPELVATLREGLDHFDIGNHHFATAGRSALAKALVESGPASVDRVIFGSSGGEAVDVALKTARHATGRRRIVSVAKAYHGHTGLAVATGDERFARPFGSERPEEFVHVPFNDLDAMADALSGHDVAAVIMETIPATYGFPMPQPGYLEGVAALCRAAGTLYIADEVQTGLMRTGRLWGVEHHGIEPDLLVTSKGLSGGLYPISAVLVSEAASGWLLEDGFAHMATFGGSELGCLVALATLEITRRPSTVTRVAQLIEFFDRELGRLAADHADWLVGVRQRGLVIGLETAHADGARVLSRHLYEAGVWAIFATLDPRVLQFKPGLLLTDAMATTVIERLDTALRRSWDEVRGAGTGS